MSKDKKTNNKKAKTRNLTRFENNNKKQIRNNNSNYVFYSNHSYNPKKTAKEIFNETKTRKNKKNIETIKSAEKVEKKQINWYFVIFIIALFALCSIILYREAILDKKVKELNTIKENIKKLEKENSQIELSFQSNLSLTKIEQAAKNRLGMKKQSSENTRYIKLNVEDFIEPVSINKIKKDERSFFEKIADFFLDKIEKKDKNKREMDEKNKIAIPIDNEEKKETKN